MKVLLFADAQTMVSPSYKRLRLDLKQRRLVLEDYNLQNRAAQDKAHLYDITKPGSIVVTRDDGAPVASWRDHLPSADEISYSLGYI
jgi:hypothetical protein